MRPPHVLRANHANSTPQDCIWFDTETTSEDIDDVSQRHILNFGWAAHRRRIKDGVWSAPDWFRFESIPYFWDWVESKLHGNCRLYMFCHNAAYDAPVMDAFRVLRERDWLLSQAVIESPPVILKWRRGNQTILIVDTLNIWRMPLDAIGKQIGLPKLKMPPRKASRVKWDRYGKRDTEIIMAACLDWFAFLLRENLGGFAPTLASQSMRAFRHRFMTHPIYIDSDRRALQVSRAALHGGRTECFYIGKRRGPLYLLDINSLYPAVMRDNLYPARLVGVYNDVSRSELARWMGRYTIVGMFRLTTDQACYPVLVEGRLSFPVGKIRAGLCTPEIAHALRQGHLHAADTVALYESADLFRPFVDTLYRLRVAAAKDGDSVGAWQFKILMNSLFGKFGQRGKKFIEVDKTDDETPRSWVEIDAHTGRVYRYRQLGGLVQLLDDTTETHDSFPAISAHVTAYGRMLLWHVMQRAGRQHYFYVDTDSILVDDIGRRRLHNLCDPLKLGALKLVDSYSSVHIRAPKDYKFDDYEKIKGVKRRAIRIDANTYEQDVFSTLIGLVRRGDLSAPIVTRVRKRLKRIYTKAVVCSDGSCTPLRRNDW